MRKHLKNINLVLLLITFFTLLIGEKFTWKLLLLNQFKDEKELGRSSQNFSRKIQNIFVTLDLKILIFLRLFVLFLKHITLKVDLNYNENYTKPI